MIRVYFSGYATIPAEFRRADFLEFAHHGMAWFYVSSLQVKGGSLVTFRDLFSHGHRVGRSHPLKGPLGQGGDGGSPSPD